MILSETFKVVAIIEKLSFGWKDFKNYLKHKQIEMNLQKRIVRFWIKKDNRDSEKRGFCPFNAKENVMEHGQSFKKRKPSWN